MLSKRASAQRETSGTMDAMAKYFRLLTKQKAFHHFQYHNSSTHDEEDLKNGAHTIAISIFSAQNPIVCLSLWLSNDAKNEKICHQLTMRRKPFSFRRRSLHLFHEFGCSHAVKQTQIDSLIQSSAAILFCGEPQLCVELNKIKSHQRDFIRLVAFKVILHSINRFANITWLQRSQQPSKRLGQLRLILVSARDLWLRLLMLLSWVSAPETHNSHRWVSFLFCQCTAAHRA